MTRAYCFPGALAFFPSFYFPSSVCAQFCSPAHILPAFPSFWEVHWHLSAAVMKLMGLEKEIIQDSGSPDTNSSAAAPASARQLGKHNFTNTHVIHPPVTEVGRGQQRTLAELQKIFLMSHKSLVSLCRKVALRLGDRNYFHTFTPCLVSPSCVHLATIAFWCPWAYSNATGNLSSSVWLPPCAVF